MSFTDKLKKFTNDAVEKSKGLAEQTKLSLENQKQLDAIKKAQQLIKLCKDKLTKTDEEIKKILESGK